ncbi:MAG: hypothetical protein U5L45_11570 [Saprospiraceae bacterium]|nr:hypothetical protein [Saprospiraceae bacterium]
MWFVFRLRRKTNHVSSLLRERSARKTSVFNQKTMFLGYAHSSLILMQLKFDLLLNYPSVKTAFLAKNKQKKHLSYASKQKKKSES